MLYADMEAMMDFVRGALATAGMPTDLGPLALEVGMLEVLVTEGSAGHLWGSWRFSLTDLDQGIR
jgi:hypothetical protein